MTDTITRRFSTVSDVRNFFRDRYYGLPINEKLVEQTCSNCGIEYIPDVIRYSENMSAIWAMWEDAI
jgi:hypothetical protein